MDFKKFYDEQSDYVAFRNNPAKREEYNIIVDWKVNQLVKLIPDSIIFDNILEIGCAMGILLNKIASRLSIRSTFGLDISAENIKVAKELYPDTIFFQGTIEDLAVIIPREISFSRFHLVVLSDIVEHIPDDLKFMKMVKEITSFVLINLPLEKCFKNRNRQYGENDPSGHLRSYDKEMALKLISMAGFDIIRSFTTNAFNDKVYFNQYRKKRKNRIKTKPLHLRIFWTLYYSAEDQIKLISNRLYEKIYGTNYFALLKSKNGKI